VPRDRQRALLTIHAAVLLFGLAGVLGKMVALPAFVIVLGRVVFGGGALLAALLWRRVPLRASSRRDLLALSVSGVLLAVHWTAFFQSILVSSVAVALLTFSTFPLFAAILEPLWLRTVPSRIEALAAVLILPGVVLLVPSATLADHTTAGAAWGVLAGATFAILSIWNRSLTTRYPSAVISLYQDGVATVVLLPAALLAPWSHTLTFSELAILLVLGIFCTALAHTLFIEGMRTVSAQTASVIAALEPVWGIAFALVLLGEVPSARVVAGGALIVGATMLPALSRQLRAPRGASPVTGPRQPWQARARQP
jgi:drug/metabolite transporter (DMT)-like permease